MNGWRSLRQVLYTSCLILVLAVSIATAQESARLDVDGNRKLDALTDGLLILRHLFGFTGPALTADAVAADAPRNEADIAAYLAQLHPFLDIDGDGRQDALTDGLLILRYLFGFRGDVLLNEAVSPNAGRTPAEIEVLLTQLSSDVPENQAPVAQAGADERVTVGMVVQLDGSASSDPDGDVLSYRWSFVSRPAGSQATLSSADTATPSFPIDQPGIYEVQLIVNDGHLDGTPDTVLISTENSPPVANAGPDQGAPVGTTVRLDGSASSDSDGDTLIYQWTLTRRPENSLVHHGLSESRV